jgi:glucokinase
LILAGDVGATKILLEVGEVRSGRWEAKLAKRYETAQAETFLGVLGDFLGEWNRVRGKADRLDAAGFGVAGPVDGRKAKMTHRPLVVDADVVESRFLIPKASVVNDLVAGAHGLDWLGPRDYVTVQEGEADPAAPRVLLGVGTGLGVAYLLRDQNGTRVLASEGGHKGFAPGTLRQAELWRSIFEAHGHVEAEDVVSGVGLTHIFGFVRGKGAHAKGAPEDTVSAAWIAERAAKGDLACSGALELFYECLGNVAGDHAVALLARGGVFLAGGVIAHTQPLLDPSRFCEAFCAKGSMSGMMMKIPVHAVTNERIVLLGAAKMMM